MSRVWLAIIGAVAFIGTAGATTSRSHFPSGTFLTKITTTDLYKAGLDINDAHWETVTFRSDGTWVDTWFHPRVPDQPPAHGRYLVRNDTLRLLGTPDTVRWRYDGRTLAFKIVHVPDRLARLIYTAHPWRRTR
jgi:hypothetical protein